METSQELREPIGGAAIGAYDGIREKIEGMWRRHRKNFGNTTLIGNVTLMLDNKTL